MDQLAELKKAFEHYTGVKVSAIQPLKWDDVLGKTHIVVTDAKTGEKQQITLPPEFIEILDQLAVKIHPAPDWLRGQYGGVNVGLIDPENFIFEK